MKEIVHDSDCAVNNEPAFPAGPCDCGAEARAQRRYVRMMGQIFYKKAARKDEHFFSGDNHGKTEEINEETTARITGAEKSCQGLL